MPALQNVWNLSPAGKRRFNWDFATALGLDLLLWALIIVLPAKLLSLLAAQ